MRQWTDTVTPYMYLMPAMIGIVGLTGGAIAASFGISLTDWDLVSQPRFVGGGNYLELVASSLFWTVVGNTLEYAVMAVPVGVTASLLLALLVNNRLPGVRLFRTAYFLPVVISMVAAAMIWSWLFNPEFGAINWLLSVLFGLQGPRWLLDSEWALPSIAVVSIWKGMGYNMIILLAALQAVPPQLEEAARLDGAGTFRRFLHVTLPSISPALFFVVVISTIGAFQIFEQTYVLTQGGPANSTLTLSYYIYQNAFQFFRMGYATAMAYFLFTMTLIVAMLQFRLQKRWVHYA